MIDGLRHIRGFLAVAQWLSFTRASIELGVSQPALTVQIQQLENALGVKLLDRNKRKVALTQAGEEMIAPLERLLTDLEAIMGASRDVAELRRGIVTVAAVPSLAATLLPRAVAEFSQSYPGVSVRLRDSGYNLMELVRAGEVDLGVGGDTHRDPEVAVQDLYAEPLCVFAPLAHPLARRRWVKLAEVTQYPVILSQRHSSLRTILQRALDEKELSFRRFHETSHLSTTIGMVNAGLGIAILPLRAIDCFLSTSIQCIAIREPTIERRVVIATKAGRSLSPAVQKLIEILHRVVHQFPERVPNRTVVRAFGDLSGNAKRHHLARR